MNIFSHCRLVGFVGFTAAVLAAAPLHAQAPANDDFANRQSIPAGLDVTVSGTTVGATQEAFEVTNAGGTDPGLARNETKTVWYDWVPTVSGTVNISLPAYTSQGQTYALVFVGGSTPTAADIVSEGFLPGDVEEGNPPPPSFAVTAGQEYTISLGNTNFPGSFTLELKTTPSATTTEPVATIAAHTPSVVRGVDKAGKFIVKLSSASTAAVTLSYAAGGTAVAGTDYKLLSGTVTIPAGQTSATIKAKLLAAGDVDGKVAIKLKLKSGDGYTIDGNATAKIKILGGK